MIIGLLILILLAILCPDCVAYLFVGAFYLAALGLCLALAAGFIALLVSIV
jgi:hypothetical protein